MDQMEGRGQVQGGRIASLTPPYLKIVAKGKASEEPKSKTKERVQPLPSDTRLKDMALSQPLER